MKTNLSTIEGWYCTYSESGRITVYPPETGWPPGEIVVDFHPSVDNLLKYAEELDFIDD